MLYFGCRSIFGVASGSGSGSRGPSQSRAPRPSSSPSQLRRSGSSGSGGVTVNGKIIENQFGVRLSSADYHDRQWSAPSLETLAREFKDVVKTSELVIYYMYFFFLQKYIYFHLSIYTSYVLTLSNHI